ERLLEPPAPDGFVVAPEQHLRYLETVDALRPRVLRAVEQPGHIRILARRILVAEHPRQQPYDRIDDHRGREFPAAQHVVADRQLFPDDAVDDALVDALVASGDEQQ